MDNSQRADVLNHLQNIGGITNSIAYEKYGVQRLSGIIHVLRKQGHDIVTLDMEGKNRHGHTSHYGKYIYKGRIEDGR